MKTTATPAGRTISVFLADDNLIVREGVRALIDRAPDLQVTGVGADYDEVIAGCEEHAPQVLVTDIRMPRGSTPPKRYASGIRAPASWFCRSSTIRSTRSPC
jgi:DNA-binding NarL/FixJ family response regulator